MFRLPIIPDINTLADGTLRPHTAEARKAAYDEFQAFVKEAIESRDALIGKAKDANYLFAPVANWCKAYQALNHPGFDGVFTGTGVPDAEGFTGEVANISIKDDDILVNSAINYVKEVAMGKCGGKGEKALTGLSFNSRAGKSAFTAANENSIMRGTVSYSADFVGNCLTKMQERLAEALKAVIAGNMDKALGLLQSQVDFSNSTSLSQDENGNVIANGIPLDTFKAVLQAGIWSRAARLASGVIASFETHWNNRQTGTIAHKANKNTGKPVTAKPSDIAVEVATA